MQDGDLVEQAQKGREDAFEKLYYRHIDKLYSLAYGIVGNQADARDVVQETFLKALKKLPKLRPDGAILGYLCRTASNAAIDVLRARRSSHAAHFDDLKESLPSSGADPKEALELKLNNAALTAAMMQLSEDHRVVVVLHHLEGCSVEEIASRLALPVGTVKSRLGRARDTLRRRLLGKVFIE